MEYKENINYETEEIEISIKIHMSELTKIIPSKTDEYLTSIEDASTKITQVFFDDIIKRIEEIQEK